MLNLEVTTRLANLDMPDAIQWLQRIYCNLYIFVKTTSRTESFLSPTVFMPCPVDSTKAMRQWFMDTWNTSLVTTLRQVVLNQNCEAQGVEFEDPVRFVIRTWPWQDQAEGLPQALLKVKTETGSGSASVKTDKSDNKIEDEDPLVGYIEEVFYEE